MKIISLNTWGGRAGKDLLLNFFRKNNEIDIFCLQEMWRGGDDLNLEELGLDVSREVTYNLLDGISAQLPNHKYYFRPHVGDHYGLVIFIKKDIEVLEEGDIFVYNEKGFYEEGNIGNHARNLQYITFKHNGELLTVINFHGLWNGKGKTDTPDRLLQSTNIINFINKLDNPYILVGDFNLKPDTESLKKIEDAGALNLIKKYNIKSTRTSFYEKEEKFADYVFLSQDLKEKDFKVLEDEVSDHAALLIEV